MAVIKSMIKAIRYVVFNILWNHQFSHVGSHSVVYKPLKVLNGKHMTIGDYTIVVKGLRVDCIKQYNDKHYSPKISIGDHCQIAQGVQISCASQVIIENGVGIGPYCMINDSNHNHEAGNVPFLEQDITTAPIRIGEGSLLGYGVCVLSGVTIGKHCFIGAGAVITKDVPDNTMVISKSELVYKPIA